MNEFEPKIKGFCCHWCSFPAANLAGDMQVVYSSNIKINILSCSGKIEVIELLKAFEEGNDGVFVIGCLEDKCFHEIGSIRARKRVNYVKSLLEEIGINNERITMYNLSVSEMAKFKEIIEEVKEKTRKLGPI